MLALYQRRGNIVATKSKKSNGINKKRVINDQNKILDPKEILDPKDQMGMLHNKFVAYISESALSVESVIVILNILLDEAIEQIRKGYNLV